MNLPRWTGEVIGELHVNGLEIRALAKKMGVSPEYASKILNGHKIPKNAEEKVKTALNELIAEKNSER